VASRPCQRGGLGLMRPRGCDPTAGERLGDLGTNRLGPGGGTALLPGYVFQMHKFPGTLRGPQDRERRAVLSGFGCR